MAMPCFKGINFAEIWFNMLWGINVTKESTRFGIDNAFVIISFKTYSSGSFHDII